MNKVIIFQNETGGVSITVPVEERRQVLVSEAEYEDVIVHAVLADDKKTVIEPERVERRLKKAAIYRPESDEEYLARIAAKAVPPGVSYQVADRTALPADRTFRNAWVLAGEQIETDMPKAREIQRLRIRGARSPVLASLDIEYQRADEMGNLAEKRRIAQRKQELRDATKDPAIDAAQTPEQLKAVWPAGLAQSTSS